MPTTVYEFTVANDKVDDVVATIQADPRYVSHKVIPNGDGTSTIFAFFKPPVANAAASVPKKKVRTKKVAKLSKSGKKKKKT